VSKRDKDRGGSNYPNSGRSPRADKYQPVGVTPFFDTVPGYLERIGRKGWAEDPDSEPATGDFLDHCIEMERSLAASLVKDGIIPDRIDAPDTFRALGTYNVFVFHRQALAIWRHHKE
jgi:hypothetical protein